VKLKKGIQSTDFLQLWFDGIPFVATYCGINTWAFELQDAVHNVTFSPGLEIFVDSMWVQLVLLASDNISVLLDRWREVNSRLKFFRTTIFFKVG
jgi:hypothetical protein